MRRSWLYFAIRSVRRKRSGLDLAGVGGHGDIGDGGVLGFTGAVADHRGVAVFLGEFDGVERLGERTDLVHLDQDRVAPRRR